MNRMHLVLKQLIAGALAASLSLQPAFALVTDISNTPLSSGTISVLPNVLFILDDSGSMDRAYNGDYVDSSGGNGAPANAVMRRSDGSRGCNPGDPCFYNGGGNGFNGIYYDPTVNYKPGLRYDGTTVLADYTAGAPYDLNHTSLVPDAYAGGTNVNLTAGSSGGVSTDRQYCNASTGGLCKRNGADTSGNVSASGGIDADTKSDGTTFTLGAGAFPFRAHRSNSSAEIFGLPEMMSVGAFSRAGTLVTVNTVAPHNLATGNRIFVANHSTLSINTTSVTVTFVNATQFTYTSGTSGTVAASDANWRQHVAATSSRASTTVTVTSTAHGLQNGDIISTFVHANSSTMNANNVTIGGVTANTFTYTSGTSGTVASGAMTWVRNGLYNVLQSNVNRQPIVYRITPVEYCSDPDLTTCALATTPGVAPAGFGFPAYVRFCRSGTDAYSPGLVSGSSGTPARPRCVSKFVETAAGAGEPTYYFVRYGRFVRDNLVSGTTTYSGRTGRADCAAAPICTYTEEIQNFARWYTYYRTRLLTMKTAAGRSFQSFVSKPTNTPPIPNKMRVGFLTINPYRNASGTAQTNIHSSRYLKVDDFSGQTSTSHAATWFNTLYAINASSVTPLRESLSTAGHIFAGKLGSGLTAGLGSADDPVQVACQRNFAILTTDGYWNNNAGRKLDGSAMDNQDNTNPTTLTGYTDPVVSRAGGTYDGGLLSGTTAGFSAGGSGTLADVALYYYKSRLREGGAASGPTTNLAGTGTVTLSGLGVVPTKPGNKDFVTHQHMVTFGIGMSDGLMRYQADYETATIGDFANIKSGVSGACSWAPGATCNWPSPRENSAPALDDLWHAAVNGRGSYYSARDTNALAAGLDGALTALNVQVAAAAASATSSPNITQTDRQIFSTTYETDTWSGKIVAQNIDPATGNVEPAILWSADTLFVTGTGAGKVASASDTRTIKTFSAGGTNKVKDFTWGSLNATEQAYFANKCTPASNMAQCAVGVLSPSQLTDLNDGQKMVGYLRGWIGLELDPTLTSGSFRDRKFIEPGSGATTQTVLGDTINAKPAYVRKPLLNYNDSVTPSYNTFKSDQTALNGGLGRSPRLYVGANDGFLHAFNGDTGVEEWAYLPRFLMPGLWALADKDYKTRHTYFVDGTPESADVYDTVAGAWKTILVGGANYGGRGFYALDVTEASTPKALWEFCSDAALCAVSDPNLGFSFGNPVIGKRSSDGRWVVVVSSGLNNVGASGDGKGYFYVLDAITGADATTGGNPVPIPVDSTVGSTTTPSGLMKIAGFYEAGFTDATFRYVYGGDQLGNVWRMDMGPTGGGAVTPSILHITTLKDGSSPARTQAITTKPVLTKVSTSGGTKRVMFFGTGRYLGGKDLKDPAAVPVDDATVAWTQTLYAFIDKDSAYGTPGSQNLRVDATLVNQTLSEPTTQTRTTSTTPVNWLSDDTGPGHDGWKIDFNIGAAGERVNIDPELILGTLVVTTNVPIAATTGAQCSVGGDSWQYQLDYKAGTYLSTAPGQVAGQKLGAVVTVGVAVVQLPSGAVKGIVTSADTSKTTIGIQLGAGAGSVRRFSYRER